MVKGISRQVIVLRPKEEKLFDQAIFLLKEDAPGVTDAELMTQARKAAHRYLQSHRTPSPSRLRRLWQGTLPWLYGAAGAAIASLFWWLV